MPVPPGVRRERWEDPDRRKQVEAELAFHLQSKIESLMAAGVPPAEAQARALAEFGPVGEVAADCEAIQRTRESKRSRLAGWRGFTLEVKATLRSLSRSPGFAAVAIATFALGIGATTAVWSLLDGILLRPMPYRNLDRVVRVWDHNNNRVTGQLTIADYRDFAAQATQFDGFAAFRWRAAVVAGADGEVSQVSGAEVTAGFFEVLGVAPMLGRVFRPGEDREGAEESAVLSFGIWRQRFGGDSSLVGRTVRIGAIPRTVIGILPPDFQNPMGGPVDVWIAGDFEMIARDGPRARRMHFLSAIARLAPSASFESGRAELETLAAGFVQRFPETNAGHGTYLKPLQEAGTLEVRPTLLMVTAAVGCLLLLTCANLANLVFARALARAREFALRSALGAGRARIIRAILVEQLGLAGAGAFLGLGLAAGTVWLARTSLAGMVPRIDRVAVDGRAFGMAAGLAIIAALISGLVPALLAVSGRRAPGFGSRSGLTRTGARGRALLLGVQAALAAMLLVAAGLTAKSLDHLVGADLGFVTERVSTFQVPLPPARYADPAAIDRFRTGLLDRIRALPGVISAAASYALPMENRSTTGLVVEGDPPTTGQAPETGYNAADGDYFRTLGIPLLEGRTFGPGDRAGAPLVLIVNRALARRSFGGRSPLGARVRSGPDPNGPWLEIVGVVGDIRRDNPAVAPVPELYFPLSQDATSQPSYSVRIDGDPAPVLARIRSAITEMDAELPMAAVATLGDVVGRTIQQPRTLAMVLAAFSVLALVVAALGIYGVIAFLVAERRRDIAIRLAIGAGTRRVLAETSRRGLVPLVAGLGGGLVIAGLSSRVVSGFLYEVAPTDPVVYSVVAAAVLAAGVAGALVPAIRATRVPPSAVLRE